MASLQKAKQLALVTIFYRRGRFLLFGEYTMTTNTLPTAAVRDIIAANGWGTIGEHSAYEATPIAAPDPNPAGLAYPVDPDALTDDEECLIADAFRMVAHCLLNDHDGTYAALLEAMMDGAQ